jgi:hypothetical protein
LGPISPIDGERFPQGIGFDPALPWFLQSRIMSSQPSIAHYRMTSKLGAGGMGEVRRATDIELA